MTPRPVPSMSSPLAEGSMPIMTSSPRAPNLGDMSAVHRLMESFAASLAVNGTSLTNHKERENAASNPSQQCRTGGHLGDFDIVLAYLGVPPSCRSVDSEPDDSSFSPDDSYSTTASSPPSDDAVLFANNVHKHRSTPHTAHRDIHKAVRFEINSPTNLVPSDEHCEKIAPPTVVRKQLTTLLTPAWVTPPKTPAVVDRDEFFAMNHFGLSPLKFTKREDIAAPFDHLMDDLPYIHSSGNEDHKSCHIFIDASNIEIGFYDALKKARGMKANERLIHTGFSFHMLSRILERGRPTAVKYLAGSPSSTGREPAYWDVARLQGYEVASMHRVTKFRPPKLKRHSGRASGVSSGSEAHDEIPLKAGEQGVDEMIHLKMVTSVLDNIDTPATMVLATGDAAEAEYSGGFLKYVERALKRGWNVEVVCWRSGMSQQWKTLLKEWPEHFIIRYLDSYLEQLYSPKMGTVENYYPSADWTE